MAPPAMTLVSAHIGRTLRALRQSRGLSMGALARAAGLSKTIVSTIESGNSNPSLESLWRLAGALDVTLSDLIGDPSPPRARLIRRDEGSPISSTSGLEGRLLHAEGTPHRTEIFAFELVPASHYLSGPHISGTEELVICLSGVLEVGPEGSAELLGEEDALWFPADVAHAYSSADGCRALCVMSYPPAHGISKSTALDAETGDAR